MVKRKTKRKKRAWNMSNPLYRYLHGKKTKCKSSKRRGRSMVKRRKSRRRRSGLGLSASGGFLKKFMPVKGALGGALAGLAGVYIANMIAPDFASSDIGKGAIGFASGGMLGAVGGYFSNSILGMVQGGSTSLNW